MRRAWCGRAVASPATALARSAPTCSSRTWKGVIRRRAVRPQGHRRPAFRKRSTGQSLASFRFDWGQCTTETLLRWSRSRSPSLTWVRCTACSRGKEPVALGLAVGRSPCAFMASHFGGRFLQMDLHRQIQLLGQGRDANHVFWREGVGGWGQGNLDLLAVPVFVPQGEFPQPFLAPLAGRGWMRGSAAGREPALRATEAATSGRSTCR